MKRLQPAMCGPVIAVLLADAAAGAGYRFDCVFEQLCVANRPCEASDLRRVYQAIPGEAVGSVTEGDTTRPIVSHVGDLISFVEFAPDGQILATSIHADDASAVLSQHGLLLNETYPVQYLGHCDVSQ